ncbi:MAG: hypothetical protein ACK59A_06815 [Cyanobacteriota bacterium]|jgi:biopolymer transport protein ExbD
MKVAAPGPFSASPGLTALGLGLLSVTATVAAGLLLVTAQRVAQRPAAKGVLVIHLDRGGGLRLWNQPLRPQDLPLVLERVRTPSQGSKPVVVRLTADADVPWGMVHALVSRLGPTSPRDRWTLQLQLP